MKKKTKTLRETSLVSSPALTIAATICGVILLAHLLTSFFPHHRVWGINHLAYFPLPIKIVLTVLSLSVFVPRVNRGMRMMARKPLASLYERISGNKLYVWYAGFSLLAVGLFWVLRSRTYFWGDGLGLVSALNKGGVIRAWSEFLEVTLHINTHKFLNLLFSADAQLTYQLLSVAAGGIFVFFVFWFSEYLGKDLFEKVFVFSILLTMGSVQLYFGSAEHYSFAYLSVFAYLVLSLKWIEEGGSLFLVLLPFVIAVAFHFASFYLLPSLAYLLLLKKRSRVNRKVIWGLELALLLAGILFLFHVFESKPGLIRIFVLPVEHRFAPGYTSFSWAHLLDLLNQHLLLSPVGLALVLAVLATVGRKSYFKNPAVRFLLLVTGFQLFFHFVIDPALAAPRDWDLFSTLSLGYTILALLLFLKLNRGLAAFKYVATIMVAVSFFSTLPWVALNVSEGKSIQRFRDVMDLDPKRSRSGHFFLARYLTEKGMIQEAEKENQKQREIYPEVVLLEEGIEYYNRGRLADALRAFQKAIQQDPLFPDVHFFLARTYYRQGVLDLAEQEYQETIRLKPEYVKAHTDLAKIYASGGKWKNAIRHYEKVLKLDVKDPMVFTDLGKIYALRREYEKATKYFRKAIEIQEDFVEAHSRLGDVCFALNRLDEAEAEYQKVIKLKPDSDYAYLLLAEIYHKKGLKESAIRILEQFLQFSADSGKTKKVRETLRSLRDQR
ncbi:MAG: tetratricopeptide repeat protein [Candidatus Zixiibacteriota bacterium]